MFKVNNKNTKTSVFDHFVGLALERLNSGIDFKLRKYAEFFSWIEHRPSCSVMLEEWFRALLDCLFIITPFRL